MSLELIKFGFTAGELAPSFYGRPDLEKFDFGLARAYNWFVDYRGGLSTRPGLKFNEFIWRDDQPIMLFEFRFNTDLANTYCLMFGHNYIRFVQDGAYITEVAKVATAITKANPGVVTSNSHGFVAGDWVKASGVGGMTELNGRTFQVGTVTTNTFQLLDHNGVNINTTSYGTFTSGGNFGRVYTLTTPYHSDDIDRLCVSQYRDRLDITHKDYAPRVLTRITDINWTLALANFGTAMTAPTGLVTQVLGGEEGGGGAYAVTAVNNEGDESVQSAVIIENNGPNFNSSDETVTIKWAPVANAQYYNIYRSLWANRNGTTVSAGENLGYLGRTFGVQLIDNGIIPDFTKTPPVHEDPFAAQRIEYVNVTADGSGYAQEDTITVTDAGGGTGFVGVLIVNSAGDIAGVRIINGGSGYVTPVAVITTAAGTGATFSFVISEATGMWPGLNAVHQQRKIYAASDNDPLTVWGSKPGLFDNMDVSSIITENDAYEFELDSGDLTPIKHLMAVRGGLLALTETGIWVINGGNESASITPTNVLADPHTFVGCGDVRPVRIDTDLIYVEHKGFTVRELAYNDFSKLYSGVDISILSNHFFSAQQEIRSWTYASDPHKVIWAAKADGKFLSLTIVKDQKVYGWAEHGTKGFVERFLTLEENGRDIVYAVVKRYVNGVWEKYLESFSSRIIADVEDAVVVDSALTLPGTYPTGTCLASSSTGAVTFTVTGATPFSSGDVGKVLRLQGGKAIITGYTSSTVLTGVWVRDATGLMPESTLVTPTLTGSWTLDEPVTTLSGLWHLEGETVQILGDGNVLETQTVVNGSITLDRAVTRASVGIAYRSLARSLPVTVNGEVVEGSRKRVVGLGLRLLESRGLKSGAKLEKLYELTKIRTDEMLGEATRLYTGIKYLSIQPWWNDDGQVYFVRDDPTPVSILGYITSNEFGDDPG